MDSIKKLVSAFVLSRLDYCNSLFAGLSNDKITKLQRIQNNAARLVLKQPKRHHMSPLLKDLHWLSIKARIDYKVALLSFKCLNNNAPAHIKDLIVPYTPARMLRSSSSNLLSTPRVSSKKYGLRAFTFLGPQIWNSLPENIRSEKGLEKFKKSLKTYLFRKKICCNRLILMVMVLSSPFCCFLCKIDENTVIFLVL